MEQHDIDIFIAMAQRQHGYEAHTPSSWIVTAMKFAYNKGLLDGQYEAESNPDSWAYDDDALF